MELIVIISIGLGLWWIKSRFFDRPSSTNNRQSHDPSSKTFRPNQRYRRGSSSASGVKFQPSPISANNNDRTIIECSSCNTKLRIPSEKTGTIKCPRCSTRIKITSQTSVSGSTQNLEGILDAFSGVQIDVSKTTYACVCGVFYQSDSWELLKAENASNCVACGNSNITLYSGQESAVKRTRARNHDPNAITLNNYKQFVNQVVTFEGKVVAIRTSRRGSDYAVMFENKSWVSGFKLVFFRGAVRKVGGARYINSLSGERLRVRGLLIKHQTFGYEIIVNDRAMVQVLG